MLQFFCLLMYFEAFTLSSYEQKAYYDGSRPSKEKS